MSRLLSITIAVILILHGRINLMGFVAYWPLKEMPHLTYETAFSVGCGCCQPLVLSPLALRKMAVSIILHNVG